MNKGRRFSEGESYENQQPQAGSLNDNSVDVKPPFQGQDLSKNFGSKVVGCVWADEEFVSSISRLDTDARATRKIATKQERRIV